LAVYFSPPLQLQIAQFSKPNTTTFSRSRRPSGYEPFLGIPMLPHPAGVYGAHRGR
jgi:hypothetical protein